MCSIDADREGVRDVKKILNNILKFVTLKIQMSPKGLNKIINAFLIHLGPAMLIPCDIND